MYCGGSWASNRFTEDSCCFGWKRKIVASLIEMPSVTYVAENNCQAANALFHRLFAAIVGDMKTLDELRALPEKASGPGVYFLWMDDELQYVGGTTNLTARMRWHRNARDAAQHRWYSGMVGRIKFNRATALPCEKDVVHQVEYSYTRQLRPPMNRRGFGSCS